MNIIDFPEHIKYLICNSLTLKDVLSLMLTNKKEFNDILLNRTILYTNYMNNLYKKSDYTWNNLFSSNQYQELIFDEIQKIIKETKLLSLYEMENNLYQNLF